MIKQIIICDMCGDERELEDLRHWVTVPSNRGEDFTSPSSYYRKVELCASCFLKVKRIVCSG